MPTSRPEAGTLPGSGMERQGQPFPLCLRRPAGGQVDALSAPGSGERGCAEAGRKSRLINKQEQSETQGLAPAPTFRASDEGSS